MPTRHKRKWLSQVEKREIPIGTDSRFGFLFFHQHMKWRDQTLRCLWSTTNPFFIITKKEMLNANSVLMIYTGNIKNARKLTLLQAKILEVYTRHLRVPHSLKNSCQCEMLTWQLFAFPTPWNLLPGFTLILARAVWPSFHVPEKKQKNTYQWMADFVTPQRTEYVYPTLNFYN